MSLNSSVIVNASTVPTSMVCSRPLMVTTGGVLDGQNPFAFAFPLFVIQVVLVLAVTRTLVFIFKPMRQPRVVSEIIGGVILGPSVFGQKPELTETFFPLRSLNVLETIANVGLLYFVFMVGLEIDIAALKRTGKKALLIAIAGMIIPFMIGIAASPTVKNVVSKTSPHRSTYVIFVGVALSITAFPVLARILAELKLLNTELGRLALSAAMVNDISAWLLLAIAIAVTDTNSSNLSSLWIILFGSLFVLVCFYGVRPLMWWVMRRTPEGEKHGEFTISMILLGVLVAGLLADIIGLHAVFGAFTFGLAIPAGPLGSYLMEKIEDMISGILLPLYFAISGLRTDIREVAKNNQWPLMVLVILCACIGKVLGTFLVAFLFRMPAREGLSLGILMNCKGLIEMVVLNIGREKKVLDEQSFDIMVLTAVFMTFIITPSVTALYRPARRFFPYKRRTVQRVRGDVEFRVLVCAHNPNSVPAMIRLLDASHSSRKSPLSVHALHLVELTGRSSTMLIVHNNTRRSSRINPTSSTQPQDDGDRIIAAFEQYQQATGVAIQALTTISPYSTMHEDVCNIAEERRVALIILPFHKQQRIDGGMEVAHPAYRGINQNVLTSSPCSVGILVDRGLGGTSVGAASAAVNLPLSVGVLFFGGPDDREALAYALRLSEHHNVRLNVMRFMAGEEAATKPPVIPESDTGNMRILTVLTEGDKDRHLDIEYVKEFRVRTVNEGRVSYNERFVNNGEETVAVLRHMMKDRKHDLFVIGKNQGIVNSTLTMGLTDWSECPELGPIGDLLSSSDFAATASVLVMQQYSWGQPGGEGPATPQTGEQHLFNPKKKTSGGGGGAGVLSPHSNTGPQTPTSFWSNEGR